MFSYMMHSGSIGAAALSNTATVPLNSSNLHFDYGKSAIDVAQRFSFSGSYKLPFGKGMYFGRDAAGVEDVLIGGWQVNLIVTIKSGFPVNPTRVFNKSKNMNNNAPDRPSFGAGYTGQNLSRGPSIGCTGVPAGTPL